MNNKIELVRGDTSPIFKFQRKSSDDVVITTLPLKMWITFKKNSSYEKCLFQKSLENGTITYNEADNYYRFQISPEDTQELNYGVYGFDVAIINEANEKITLLNKGVLELVEHYTHKSNEV